MDYLQSFTNQFRGRLAAVLVIDNAIVFSCWWLGDKVLKLHGAVLLLLVIGVPVIVLIAFAWIATMYLTKPTSLLWQAVLHILPDSHNIPAPKLEDAPFGHELISRLSNDIYQLAIDGAKMAAASDKAAHDVHQNEIAKKFPLPAIILDAANTITYANPAALDYFGLPETEMVGKNFYTLIDLSFPDNNTFDSWLKGVRAHTITAKASWIHVRTTLQSKRIMQFDMAASYSKDDPAGNELIVAFFDRTTAYEHDDAGLSFISLVVHELRTPLSLLLSYIELFEDEIGPKPDPELTRFMEKMKSAGQNLSSFVSNILTVARIENNQLELKLTEEDWTQIVTQAVNSMRVRAGVHGMDIELTIDKDLPKVAANPVTASEVVINLIDNAIKYSQPTGGKKIIVHVGNNQEGLIETTVQDFGVGIPTTVMPTLFAKFSRNFRNQSMISGTGLGLYLSKLIVDAHGGHIWVQSHEGQGTTFGFTLQPYTMLASELKNSNNTDIVRSAHGWVKNHSLYRS